MTDLDIDWSDVDVVPRAPWPDAAPEPAKPCYTDVAALLAGGLPEPQPPVLLTRDDGHALLYAGKINVLFGDPESGKTWIGLAALAEALRYSRRAAAVDVDHNGASEILSRLLLLGATPAKLGDPDLFRLYEPEDETELGDAIHDMRTWRPATALLDSLGELLPMLRLSSNSPDDFTVANRRVMTPLANVGTAVIVIDHLPKNDEARAHGQTGTLAKKRTINGASYRVTCTQAFAPGKGGAASLTVEKDRPGGVRAHCPGEARNQPAGRFVLNAHPDGTASWHITQPKIAVAKPSDADLAELLGMKPAPTSKGDVMKRTGWGSGKALNAWRAFQQYQSAAEQGGCTDDDD